MMECRNKKKLATIEKEVFAGGKYPRYLTCIAEDGTRIRYKADMVIKNGEKEK